MVQEYEDQKIAFKESAPVSLFNGYDLTGWTQYGTEKWYVEDSLLVCESGPDKGMDTLATDTYYKDFDLSVDFRQISDSNSGVFFRSVIERDGISGWQVEVALRGMIQVVFMSLTEEAGWYRYLMKGENILIPGEWNRMRIHLLVRRLTSGSTEPR
ncbi:MAG: DUF1080 domain-containing protein [Bacteroidales bacterium]